jgi:hypothetical protein
MLQKLAEDGPQIVLAHYDFGFGVKEKDVAEAARLSPVIASVMVPGGLIVSGQPLVGFEELAGPKGIPEGRYLFYRA